MYGQVFTKKVTCHATTPVAIAVDCGFIPQAVDIINIDGTNKAHHKWTTDMGAGKAWKVEGTMAEVSSGGITVKGDATKDTYIGFEIGTGLQNAADDLIVIAYR